MGYWDRHGFPDLYTGPTAGGVAPLNSNGSNVGIRSMWASKAGFDGRPADKPGHLDDYWMQYDDDYVGLSYESTEPDPYVTANRPEHAPDCIGDFMGASQNKWSDLNGECSGNIDAFSFNFWDKSGQRRENFTPPPLNGLEVRDIQSGWRRWAEYRGYKADVTSQMTDFNPEIPFGTGFTFEDMKAEINAGYPVMLFLQDFFDYSRPVANDILMPRANPIVHGMVAYGYTITDTGAQYVRYRTSWASGDNVFSAWDTNSWQAGLSLRGVIMFHPLPKLRSVARVTEGVNVKWDGPSSFVHDETGAIVPAHFYLVERSTNLSATDEGFSPVSELSTNREVIVPDTGAGQSFFRVKLVNRTQQLLQ